MKNLVVNGVVILDPDLSHLGKYDDENDITTKSSSLKDVVILNEAKRNEESRRCCF